MSSRDDRVRDDTEQLRMVVQKLARRIRHNRSDESLSDSHMVVLFQLERYGVLAPVDLAAAERVSPPSINRTLNALEERGLVERRPSETDARRVDVHLTPAGQELILATRRLRTEWFNTHFATLADDEQRALRAALPALQRLAES
ncbi:MAG: MarR family transcriptional regulator [Leifsonia sp.]|nr:MarR family transcriptional regulator [Leifsonia sp.]